MTRVAVLGASGFVGRHVADALAARGADVLGIAAPRLVTSARELDDLVEVAGTLVAEGETIQQALQGVDVVINAAGLALATSEGDDELFGANALLPALLARVCAERAVRFVHVSSAAVQGRRPVLDESTEVAPFSPYSASKALGEAAALAAPSAVVFRPTSVHGRERSVTASLCRFAASPLATVASPGDGPTPQVHVLNVADAIAFTALTSEQPPRVVLQPAEGLTTAGLIEVLGSRKPLRLPRSAARTLVSLLFAMGRLVGGFAGVARRLEMLWFGQRQAAGWLDDRWRPVATLDDWKQLR